MQFQSIPSPAVFKNKQKLKIHWAEVEKDQIIQTKLSNNSVAPIISPPRTEGPLPTQQFHQSSTIQDTSFAVTKVWGVGGGVEVAGRWALDSKEITWTVFMDIWSRLYGCIVNYSRHRSLLERAKFFCPSDLASPFRSDNPSELSQS